MGTAEAELNPRGFLEEVVPKLALEMCGVWELEGEAHGEACVAGGWWAGPGLAGRELWGAAQPPARDHLGLHSFICERG